MVDTFLVVAFLVGSAVGALASWLWRSQAVRELEVGRAVAEERASHLPRMQEALREQERQLLALQRELGLEQRRSAELQTAHLKDQEAAERLRAALQANQQQLSEHFGALSRQTLEESVATFLQLAKTELGRLQESSKGELASRHARFEELVKPFKESLEKLDGKVHELEKARLSAYEVLLKELGSVRDGQEKVRTEASNLVKALRTSHVRGRWGEVQLRRVVELAGMSRHCDFVEQESACGDEQRLLRPDLVVKLPGDRNIVVDAKTPCHAYLEAIEAPTDELRAQKLKEHARQLADKIDDLASKSYATYVQGSLGLVVLFLPAEPFLSAAFEQDPHLVERAFQKNVVIATPMTLMSLLRAVAYGWKQQDVARSAQEIARLGSELYDRLCTLEENFGKVGAALGSAVKSYNAAVGSFESRVIPKARQLKETHAIQPSKELASLDLLQEDVRLLNVSR